MNNRRPYIRSILRSVFQSALVSAPLFAGSAAHADISSTILTWNAANKYTDKTPLVVSEYLLEQSADPKFFGLTITHEIKTGTTFTATELIGEGANYFRIFAVDHQGNVGRASGTVIIDETSGLPRRIMGCSVDGIPTTLNLNSNGSLSYLSYPEKSGAANVAIRGSASSATCTPGKDSDVIVQGTSHGRRTVALMSQNGNTRFSIKLPAGASNAFATTLPDTEIIAVAFARRRKTYLGLYQSNGKTSIAQLPASGHPVDLSAGSDQNIGIWVVIKQAPKVTTLVKIAAGKVISGSILSEK